MKFEEIRWQPGDRIQDSRGVWLTFVEDDGCEFDPLIFEVDGGHNRLGFTRQGLFIEGDPSGRHLLPETYKPALAIIQPPGDPNGDRPASEMTKREEMAMRFMASLIACGAEDQSQMAIWATRAAEALLKSMEGGQA